MRYFWLCVIVIVVFAFAGSNLVNCAILRVEQTTSGSDIEANAKETKAANSTLELVHVLFRHGPRTPVNTYPNDPYLNETYEPFGWGQLTNGAKVELYKIGKQLRKRYVKLLGPHYKSDITIAQSSASPRTIMSMQMVLAGLYPPENTALEWNYLLNWQPIPVFTEPEAQDVLLRQVARCPRYDEALEEVMQLPEVLALHAEHAELLNELTTITGMNISTAHDVCSLYITLLAELAYGLPLPKWSKDYFPAKMERLAAQAYLYNVYTTEMRKIKGGFFLAKMFEQMLAKVKGRLVPKNRKLFIYCAHDWSVANILSALNVWQLQMPNFSALMAFELHKNRETGAYFVEIYFQNDPNEEPKPLTVPGCEFQCPLDRLMALSALVLPDKSYEDLCHIETNGIGTKTTTSDIESTTSAGLTSSASVP